MDNNNDQQSQDFSDGKEYQEEVEIIQADEIADVYDGNVGANASQSAGVHNDYDDGMNVEEIEYLDDEEQYDEDLEDDMVDLDQPQIRISTEQSIFAIALNRQYPLLTIGGSNDQVSLFQYDLNAAPSAVLVKEFDKHSDSIVSIKWSHDNQYCACAGMDGKVLVLKIDYNSQTCNVLEEFWLSGPEEITYLTWHQKGLVLCAGTQEGSVWVWHVPTQKVMRVMTGSINGEHCVDGHFVQDGKYLLNLSVDPCLSLMDIKNDAMVWRAQVNSHFRPSEDGLPIPAISLAVQQSANLVAVGTEEGKVYLLNGQTGKVINQLAGHSAEVEQIKFWSNHASNVSGGLNLLVTASMDFQIIVWNLDTLSVRTRIDVGESVNSVYIVSDIYIVCTDVAGSVYVYNLMNGQQVGKYKLHRDPILCSDNVHDILASADDHGDICLLRISSQSQQ
ncbi:hypothetical protein MIR68_000089 [Amoeboaphelidium protococcarum]|nr:hypothetical protein MIR68_000089 [Amoeboaphelidium protococcarum]